MNQDINKANKQPQLQSELWHLIHQIVQTHPDSQLLTEGRHAEMATALTEFVVGAMNKYYKGQLKYGGDICDKDLRKEIRDEDYDRFWYFSAEDWGRAM